MQEENRSKKRVKRRRVNDRRQKVLCQAAGPSLLSMIPQEFISGPPSVIFHPQILPRDPQLDLRTFESSQPIHLKYTRSKRAAYKTYFSFGNSRPQTREHSSPLTLSIPRYTRSMQNDMQPTKLLQATRTSRPLKRPRNIRTRRRPCH